MRGTPRVTGLWAKIKSILVLECKGILHGAVVPVYLAGYKSPSLTTVVGTFDFKPIVQPHDVLGPRMLHLRSLSP